MAADAEPPIKLSRETHIRVDREGQFFHEGDPITHPVLAERLATWLSVDPESGRYILANQVNWAFLQVDDTPLVVKALEQDPAGLRVLRSDGVWEPLDLASLRLAPDGAPYCDVRGGAMPARFARSAAHALLERLDEDAGGQVTLTAPDGRRVPVPRVDAETARRRR
jgi:hypothetical protein